MLKNPQIKRLQSIIEKQKNKIKELKEGNDILEKELIDCIKLKEQSLSERNEALAEKKTNLILYYICHRKCFPSKNIHAIQIYGI